MFTPRREARQGEPEFLCVFAPLRASLSSYKNPPIRAATVKEGGILPPMHCRNQLQFSTGAFSA